MKKALLPIICLSAVGCVSSGKYDAAMAELRACKTDGDNQRSASAQLEKAKAESEEKLRQLTAELRDLGTESKKLENEKGNLAEGMTKLQAELLELRRQEEAERQRAAIFQDLVNKLKGMIDAGKLQVYIRNGRMLVKLPDNVLFDPGKTDIKSAGKDAIAQLTAVLQAIPDRKFQVAGHTDTTPIHTARFPSNWELSTERAVNVVKFMIKSGLEARRLSAAGFADNDPVASNDEPSGKAQNRRIEVELLPNLAELPKFEDPNKTARR